MRWQPAASSSLIEDSALYQVETHEIVLKSKLKIRRSCGNRKEIYELFE